MANQTKIDLRRVRHNMRGIAREIRDRAVVNAVMDGARLIRDDARELAPVRYVGTPALKLRKRGTIIARRSGRKTDRLEGTVKATVTMKRRSPAAYFAHLPEFGTFRSRARPFLRPAAHRAVVSGRLMRTIADRMMKEQAKIRDRT